MHHHAKRSLLLGLAMLTALAVVAAPANASLTPTGIAVTGTSNNFSLTRGASRIRCPRGNFSGRVNAGGSTATGDLTFSDRTCTESGLGTSCTVIGSGNIAITVQSSVAGTSASGRSELIGTNFAISCPTVGIRSTINRARQDMGACLTFVQATQALTLTNCAVVDDASARGSFNATYVISSPRITVS